MQSEEPCRERSRSLLFTRGRALRRFKAKTLSPVELMTATITRAEAAKKKINCLAYTHFYEAMDGAKKAEAKYAKGASTGALEGLAIGIKDESYIKGKRTSGGSLIMKDCIADHASPMNERIIKAGGIVPARTATPEFSCAGYTWSKLWGVTRNPWNPKFTPGRSSGGTAASLASGTSAIATGSDIGGSIRIPASTCGLVGYKPPYGRNPDDPPFNLGWTGEVLEAGLTYLRHLFGASLSRLLKRHGKDMTTYARAFAKEGQSSKAMSYETAQGQWFRDAVSGPKL